MPIQSLQKRRPYQRCPPLGHDDVNRNFQVANNGSGEEGEENLLSSVGELHD
jgi:hypothetical protein